MQEFAIIEQYFKKVNQSSNTNLNQDLKLGIGDDCAVVSVKGDTDLLITTDTLVEGTHFLLSAPADSIGYKSLAVSLSDIAAMGAMPKWVLLNLTVSEYNPKWFEDFSTGFKRLLQKFDLKYNLTLIGGDTTSVVNQGPISITTTVIGVNNEYNKTLSRDQAKVKDGIFITGNLGEPYYVLKQLFSNQSGQYSKKAIIEDNNKLYYPEPRIDAGLFVAQYAHAAVDLSDGLLADLGHILKQSNKAAIINIDALPKEKKLIDALDIRDLLTKGDEYEIIFTAPIEYKEILESYHEPITCIGQIEDCDILEYRNNVNNIILMDKENNIMLDLIHQLKHLESGWEHF